MTTRAHRIGVLPAVPEAVVVLLREEKCEPGLEQRVVVAAAEAPQHLNELAHQVHVPGGQWGSGRGAAVTVAPPAAKRQSHAYAAAYLDAIWCARWLRAKQYSCGQRFGSSMSSPQLLSVNTTCVIR